MIRLLLIAVLCSHILTLTLSAQRRRAGLIMDDNAYRKTKVITPYSGEKSDNLPIKFSLRSCCPTPQEQGDAMNCVGWATGYAALTIAKAVQANMSNTDSIDNITHSALYLYNKIKSSSTNACEHGTSLYNAFEQLKKGGDCLSSTFTNDVSNCGIAPSPNAEKEANLYRIKDYAILFTLDDSSEARVTKVCEMLVQKNPVVVGMFLPTTFYDIKNGQKNWNAPENDVMLQGGHAMTIIGYDLRKKTFEVMNSWGQNWGDNGFVNISFDAFKRFVRYGYIMIPDDKIIVKPTDKIQPQEDLLSMAGEFAFRFPTGVGQGSKGEEITLFEEAKAQYNPTRNAYELIRKDWKAGETVFQLLTRNVPKGKYVYVFSLDPKDKLTTHYPFDTNDFANFMPSPDVEIIVPSPDDAMILSAKGEDFLTILYSDTEISDFSSRLDRMKDAKGNYNERLEQGFSDLFIKESAIKYDANTMRFSSQTKVGEGSVVPITLVVEGK